MSFFTSLFSKEEIYHLPALRFGRFTEHFLDADKIAKWDEAMLHYEKKDFTKSYIALLEYIQNEDHSNLSFKEKLSLRMGFELIHGSKLIYGYSNQNGFYATAKLVHVEEDNAALFKILLAENYTLRYNRFALDDVNNLVVLLHFDHINASPLNLFRGLREMAILCDTKDDIIVADYPGTSSVNMKVERTAGEDELRLKYQYFHATLDGVLKWYHSAQNLIEKQPGLALFAFLSSLYKIDYLVKPEGKILEKIQEIHTSYHHNKDKIQVKTSNIHDIITGLSLCEKSAFDVEIYDTILSFGILQDCNTEKAKELIASELHYAGWYIQQRFDIEASYILDYITSHLLFTFNLSKRLRSLLHLYLEINETEFFEKLGKTYFNKKNNLPKKKAIIERIQYVLKNNQMVNEDFPFSELKFDNKISFAHSMLNCISKTEFDD